VAGCLIVKRRRLVPMTGPDGRVDWTIYEENDGGRRGYSKGSLGTPLISQWWT